NINLVIFNQAFKDFLTGITGREPKSGESVLMDIFGDDLIERWRKHYRRALCGEHFVSVEEYVPPNATKKYIEVSFNPIRNNHNSITGVSCLARDIPKNLERFLRLNAGEIS